MPVATAPVLPSPALPFHLRFAVDFGLSERSRLSILCALVDVALASGLWDDAELDAGLDAALDDDDRGPLARALSRIFGGADVGGRDV